jgi:hypothetical protein
MPRWLRVGSVVGLVALGLLTSFTAVAWIRGPSRSFRRDRDVCGIVRSCDGRLWIAWQGEVRRTEATEWLGDEIPDHDHRWAHRKNAVAKPWGDGPIGLRFKTQAHAVASNLYLSHAGGDRGAEPLAREFLEDVRELGEEVAVASWRRRLGLKNRSAGGR